MAMKSEQLSTLEVLAGLPRPGVAERADTIDHHRYHDISILAKDRLGASTMGSTSRDIGVRRLLFSAQPTILGRIKFGTA
jgi:hypothetical protein